MNIYTKQKRKHWLGMWLIVILSAMAWQQVAAQCAVPPVGCSTTDLSNYGLRSNNNAATIEYDNLVSGFHATVVRNGDGTFKVWGERAANGGNSNITSPVTFNSTNYPALTGTPLKFSCGSYLFDNQWILLATNGLYAWGRDEGVVLDGAITSSFAFQKLTINGNSNGLPTGVVPADVKMMFAARGILSIVTCSGSVYVITQNDASRGTVGGSNLQWYQIQTSTGPLTDVVAVRGNGSHAFIALKSDGTVWTWGKNVYLGNGTAAADVLQATQMTIPAGVTPKMIGATAASNSSLLSSFYLLATDGNLYSLGRNDFGQLGDWTTTERLTWVQPRYTSAAGPVMNNIKWIAPQEHHSNAGFGTFGPYACINVLTNTGQLYAFGQGGDGMIGLSGAGDINNPGMPSGIAPTDVILAVETGGHTSMIVKQCAPNFGYVGHRIGGSMGNGSSADVFETTYTYNTAPVQICGAETAAISISQTPTGPTGKYCVGSVIPITAVSAGGVLSATGPGTLSGNNLTVTGAGTITLVYNLTSVCGTALVATLDVATEVCCAAGTTAPTLSAITKANVCPDNTVNLTSITASNLPASTTLTWHTGTPATTANKITGTAVAAGTYYAAFFDATNNCYSSATTAVTATVAACGDNDNDGVPDTTDLDDDNDGILDTIECPSSPSPAITAVSSSFTDSGLPGDVGDVARYTNVATYQGQNVDLRLTVLANSNPTSLSVNLSGFVSGAYIFPVTIFNGLDQFATIKFDYLISGTNTPITMPSTLTWRDIDYILSVPGQEASAGTESIMMATNRVASYSVSTPTVINANNSGGNLTFTSGYGYDSSPVDPQTMVEVNMLPASSFTAVFRGRTSATGYFFGAFPLTNPVTTVLNPIACLDTDGDNIPNYLDTDSDNDGCTDANEYYSSPTASGTDGGAYGTGNPAVNANGTVIAASYSGTYTNAINSAVSTACADNDNDGVSDITDLDDDNDGILDTAEGQCFVSSDPVLDGFDSPLYPNINGNNIIGSSFNGWTTQNGSSFNIIRVDGSGYNVGAALAHSGTQYIDIAGASDFPVKPFNITGGGIVTASAWFNNRDSFSSAYQPWTARMEILDASNNVIKQGSLIPFTNATNREAWLQSTISNFVIANSGVYKLRIYVDDYGHADDVSFCVSTDSDGDGIANYLDTDSDNDGCTDANEYYNNATASGTDGGAYGTGNPAVNANGTVIAASYSGTYTNAITATNISITTQPAAQTINLGANASFTAAVSANAGATSYQWQVSTNGGTTFTNVANGGVYSGATAATLTLTAPPTTYNNYQYKAVLTMANYACGAVTNPANLVIIDTTDNDNDGIPDTTDLDDDNDGILDTDEYGNCISGVKIPKFFEDFGTGGPVSSAYVSSTYTFSTTPDIGANQYAIVANARTIHSLFVDGPDHSTPNGRMLVVNASATPGEFYRRTVPVTPNAPLQFDFWVKEAYFGGSGNISAQLEPGGGGTLIGSVSTGSFVSDGAWHNYVINVNPGNNSSVDIILRNNYPTSAGNDLLIDDIRISQIFCDTDNDNIPNYVDTDSDNDGCTDANEYYNSPTASGTDGGAYGTGNPAVNANGTVIAASYTGTYTNVINNAVSTACLLPIASNDADNYKPNTPKTVSVLTNDITGDVAVATTVSIVGGSSPDAAGEFLTKVVAGEGTWTVNPTTGAITFTAVSGFMGNPTPIQYTVKDAQGSVSNAATVTLTAVSAGLDITAVCGSGNVALTGTPNTGTWTVKAGNPVGGTLGTTTAGVANVSFASGANGTYSYIYTVGSTSDTMSVVVSCPAAFNCDGFAYLFKGASSTTPTSMYAVDLSTGLETLVAASITVKNINGMGYNVKDGYIWGTTTYTSDTLVRVASNGTVNFFRVVGAPAANAGDVDGNGILYSRIGGNLVVKMDINPASPTYLTVLSTSPIGALPAGVTGFLDWAYNPVDGFFYAVSNGGEILKFDLTTPSTTIVANTGTVMPANSYGAVYFDNAGNFYASNNTTGDLYKIVNINTAPVALVAASGTPAANNDGARCFNACVKPKAGPDQTNIVLGATVTLAPELTATGTWAAQAGNPATTAFANASVANTTVTGFTAVGTYKFIWSVLGGCADTMQVVVIQLPIASNDADNYKPNTPKTINVLTNDITGSTVVATTVSIVGGSNPDAAGEFLTKVVAGEGTWTVNPTTGAITFTAVSGFTGNPTPIQYTVKNAQGNISNAATVTLTAVSAGLDITAVCGSGNIALTGTPNTGTWTVKAGNPVGGTLGTTTAGVANVSFGSGANGTYSYIYTVGSTSDTMSVVVSCPQPFACNGFGYLFKGTSGTTPTSMYAVDLSTGIETLVSANITAKNINGLGYNVKDGYIWGTPAYTTDTLVRLASDGTVNFFRVVGAPPAFVGDVDANGILHSKSGLDVIKIDVNPASPTYLTVVGSTTMADLGGAAIADWAFNPIDGFLYTINNNGEILKINLTTPSNTVVAYTGTTIPVNNYGAVYFDNAGNFYASNNATGDLYKIVNINTAPVALVAASGTPASSNDGARCFNACVKPKAGPDQTNIALGTTVTLAPELTATGAWTAQAGNPATTVFANASVANTTVTGFTAVGTYKFIWSVLGGCADTMQVVVIQLPVATNDVDTYTAGVAKTVAVLTNDITGGAIVPSTVEIGGSDAGSNGKTKTVAGEGVWTVNATTGVIIFTPAPGYVGNPTPIAYTGKDAFGNVSNAATVTLTANCPVITALAANKVNPTTCGGNNGSIKICGLVANSSGYTITYDKNGTPATAISGQTADASGCIIIAGLTSGTYTNIKVTNASCVGGSNTVGPIALSDPATATITLGTTQNPTACGLGDGIIQISGLTSGTLYTLNYNLNGSAQTPIAFTATGATYTMSGLVAGNYTGITVTSNNCISNALTKVLSDPITATISLGTKSDPTACSANDGSFTISGLAPSTQYVLNYTKDGFPQTPISFTSSGVSYMVSGLTRGTYTNIRVTNSNCTSNSISTSLNDPSAAVISAGVPTQPSACGATNGSITISGLVPGNTYIIKYKKNGIWQSQISYAATSTSYTINGLSAGSYTNITVTNGGCTSNALSQTLTDPGAATLALGTITQPNPCGANNGSIVIAGLTNGLSYTLNYVKDGVQQTSATFTASSTSYTLSGLTVGLYTGINVTQATCTSNTLNASLTNPSGLNIDVVGVSPLTCSPGNEGSLLITGLSQGISYTISYKKDGAVQTPITFTSTSTSYKINGLTAGSYTEIIATQATCASNVMSETLSSPALLSTPVLSSNTLANICPALTADLTDITASNTPAGTTLSWHSGTPATAINKIADPTSVLSGTYYAAFYNATTNCYGNTSPVTATVASCSPVANPDASTAVAGTPTTILILTNDKNADGTPVTGLTKITTPVVSTLPTKGTATVNPDGTIKYTPNAGTSGTDTFIYTICDKVNTTSCDTAKVTVTITPSPVANPDASTATAGFPTTIPILTNDKNPDGTPVTDLTKITTPVVSTLPTKGTVSVNPDGSIKYTPNSGTGGTDTFIYTICDKVNTTICDTAKVTVTITPAPVANPDGIVSTTAGFPSTIPVLTNDKNPDGTPVTDLTKITTPVVSTLPTKGTVSVNPDGTIKYTPNAGTSGTDTFIYTICDKVNTTVCDTAKVTVSITPAPVANPDGIVSTTAGFPSTIPVLTNDKNPDGTPVTDLTKITTPVVSTLPTKGTVSVNPDGTIKYTPNAGTSGTDTFIYTICDKVNTTVCDTAKVTVSITPAPVANPDGIVSTTAGFPSTIPVLTNDKNPDGTPVTDLTKITTPVVSTLPTKGTVSVNPDGTIKYTPNAGTSGTDTFIYTICDKVNTTVCDTAKVTVSITPSPVANPDQPAAVAGLPTKIPVLANDKNPDGTPVTDLTKITTPVVSTLPTKGTATVNPDGTINYTPNIGTSGTDTFIYTICDKVNTTVCDTAKVTVTITPAPVANPDQPTAIAGTPTTIPVLTNDKNPDGTPVTDLTKITTPVVSTLPTKGTVSVNPDGSIKYTPNPGTSGTDTFIYTICDKVNTIICDTAKVTVTIIPSPVANPDGIVSTTAGLPTTIPVLTNDKNPDGTPVTDLTKITTPVVSTLPTKGTTSVNPDGTIKYTPNAGTSGTDTFIYTICDKVNTTVCDTAKVTVTITPAPVANPDPSTAIAGTPTTIPVLTNDKNPDGTPVTDLTKITNPVVSTLPTKGTTTVNPDGTIKYTPNPGTSGTDTFIYTICDKVNTTVCDTAKVTVTITPAPVANPDQPTAVAGTPTTIPVLTNDKNPDGTPVTDLTKVTLPTVPTTGTGSPTKGTVTVNPDGTIKYTPNPGTSGTDTFIYGICDKTNPVICDTAKVTITIIPAPVANPDGVITTVAGISSTIPVLTNDKNPDGTPVTDLTKISTPVVTTPPTKGLVSVNPDGTISYSPNPASSGTDSFIYTICDKTNPLVCDTAKVSINILPTPIANPDASSVIAGLPTTIPVLTNDKNPDGTPVTDLTKITTPVVSTLPTKGTTSVNPDGSIKYTPNPGTSGTDTFTYTICDKANPTVCDTAKVTVTITPAPVANPDGIVSTTAGLPTTIPVLTNDKNPDGTPVTDLTKITTPVVSTLPTKGTTTVNPDGSIKYTPNAGTSGTDTFIYTICDKVNTTVCDTAKVTVTITPAPVANPDQPTAIAGLPTTIPVLTNDKNPDGTPVTDLTKVTLPTVPTTGTGSPTKGTVTVNPDGTIKYTPNPGTSGTDTFIYGICDKANPAICDTAKVTVTITPAPIANPDGVITTIAGISSKIPVLTNDKNPDGTPVTDLTKISTPVVTTPPTKGLVSVNPDGTINYSPNPASSGTDTFIYTICDKTNPLVCDTAKVSINILPTPIANPDASSVTAGLPTTIPVLTNDKNPDGTPVTDLTKITTPVVSTLPTKGTTSVNPDGTIKYTPNPGTSGTDTFIYTICDKANPTVCDTAKVTVTITPAPVANPDQPTVIAGIPTTIPVLTNDKNPDGTPVTDLTKITNPVVSILPTKGTTTVNPDGTIKYTPNPGTSGTDTFTYTICDKVNTTVCDTAKVTVTITPTPVANPDQPTAVAGLPTSIPVLANDKNPDGTPVIDLTKITTPVVSTLPTKGTTSVNPDGTIKYTPNVGTSGTDTFIYTICDKVNTTVCDTAKVTVTITPAPVANPDQPTVIAGIPTTIPVLTNDKNPDGTPVTDLTKITTPVVSTLPTKGTTSVNPDGSIKYTPNPGTSGTDTFTYTICDKVNTTVCDTAKVTVTITPTPVANPDQPTAVAGLPTSIPVLANDKNPDGTPVTDLTKITTPVVSTLPTKGTTTVNPDGSIKYTPNAGTSGTDTFIYTICDKVNTAVCDTAKVTVTITPAPVANPDQPTVIAGIPTTIPVLTNDKNPDGTPVTDLTKITTPVVSTLPTKGTTSVNPDGSIKYTPNPGTSGTDTFTYTICDKVNTTVCDTAKVTVTITPAPVANPDQPTAIAGTPTTIPVLTNDKNPDGTPVTDLTKITTPVVSTLPTKGTTTVNPDGSIKYTPNPGTSGTDTFTYTICDKVNTTVCDTAKVMVTITPAPVANPDQTTAVAGTPKTIPVLTNDKNPDGTPVTDLTKVTLPTVPTTGTGSPTKGTVTVNPDGTIKYTPNVGTSGTDTFIYGICDKTNPAICDTAKVTVTITPPTSVLNPDFNVTQLGVPVTGNVNTNDASVPVGTTYGTPIPSPSNPSACTPIMASNGSYSFVCSTPGVYNYNVPVCPPGVTVNCPLVPLEITVTNVNTPNTNGPIANPDFASTPINVPVTLKTLANDASGNPSAALNPSSVSVTIAPKNGTTSVDPLTGNITYTPNTGFVGNDTLTYKVCDNASPVKCGTAIQVLTVLPVATPNTTVAVDDFNTTTINTPQTGNVSTNDSDPQGQPQTVTPQTTTSAGKGTLVLSSNGSYTFTPATGYTGPVDFPYTTCDNGTPQACANATLHILINPALVAKLNLKVLLQGALLPSSSNSGIIATGIMRDDLRTAGVIPTTEPYTAIGSTNSRFTHVGGGGGETTSSAVLSTSGNDAIVDWVFVELRDANNPSTVIKTKSALVQRDGDVVEASDGISAVTFAGAIGQNYYVSVKHRNHLGAMTATAIPMTVVGTTVDFTSMTANQMYNSATQYDGFEQVDVNGKMALWGGNTNADNKVKYVGVSNDQIPVFSQVLGYAGNTTQQYNYDFASPVYLSGDVNMDAKVKYRGPNNDPTFIFFNVITKYATLNAASLYNYDLFLEQLP